jgi:hypothetical protein
VEEVVAEGCDVGDDEQGETRVVHRAKQELLVQSRLDALSHDVSPPFSHD